VGNLVNVPYEHYDLDLYGSRWFEGVPVYTFYYPSEDRMNKIKKVVDMGWSLKRACLWQEVEYWRVIEMLRLEHLNG